MHEPTASSRDYTRDLFAECLAIERGEDVEVSAEHLAELGTQIGLREQALRELGEPVPAPPYIVLVSRGSVCRLLRHFRQLHRLLADRPFPDLRAALLATATGVA